MRVAGLVRRTAAAVVDGTILVLTAGALNWGLLGMLGVPGSSGSAFGLDGLLRALELDVSSVMLRCTPFFAMSGLYLGLFWALTGRTPGQRLLELRVVDPRGNTPRPLRAGLRVLGLGLGLLPGALGWLWAAFDLERRAWHDHLARTYVVRDATSRTIVRDEPRRDVVPAEAVRDS